MTLVLDINIIYESDIVKNIAMHCVVSDAETNVNIQLKQYGV